MHELFSARTVYCGMTCSIFLAVCVVLMLMFITTAYWIFSRPDAFLVCLLQTKNAVRERLGRKS